MVRLKNLDYTNDKHSNTVGTTFTVIFDANTIKEHITFTAEASSADEQHLDLDPNYSSTLRPPKPSSRRPNLI
jgi:hypothetical protein